MTEQWTIYWLPGLNDPRFLRPESQQEEITVAREIRPGEKVELFLRSDDKIKKHLRKRKILTVLSVKPTKQVRNPQILTDRKEMRSLGGGTFVRRVK